MRTRSRFDGSSVVGAPGARLAPNLRRSAPKAVTRRGTLFKPMISKIDAPLVPLILSGGSGTRLWPMSRELTPKQFLPLVTKLSLLQETLQRAQSIGAFVQRPIIVCNEAHRFLVAEQ